MFGNRVSRILQRFGNPSWAEQHRIVPASADYVILDPSEAARHGGGSWLREDVAQRQHAAWQGLVDAMRAGQPREDLLTAAEAIRCTGMQSPSILEVGCGSGYYSHILSHLLGVPIKYVGVDYSLAMVRLGGESYPARQFVAGDGAALPFRTNAFPVVLNGASLMHTARYADAIREAARVASRWCVFHTVPVLQDSATTFLRKRVYGEAGLEVVLNEQELRGLMEASGLTPRRVLESIPYNLEQLLGEPTVTKTYVCEVSN